MQCAGSVFRFRRTGAGSRPARGAAAITMVELEPRHLRVIGENLARVQKAGVQCKANLLNCSALEPRRYSIPAGSPDLILADPPYPRSAEFFGRLMRDEFFRMHFAGARLVWELPDTPARSACSWKPPGRRRWRFANSAAPPSCWERCGREELQLELALCDSRNCRGAG